MKYEVLPRYSFGEHSGSWRVRKVGNIAGEAALCGSLVDALALKHALESLTDEQVAEINRRAIAEAHDMLAAGMKEAAE